MPLPHSSLFEASALSKAFKVSQKPRQGQNKLNPQLLPFQRPSRCLKSHGKGRTRRTNQKPAFPVTYRPFRRLTGLSGDLPAFSVTYRPFRRLTGLSGDLSAFPATYRPFCRRSLLLPAACDILILFPNLLSAREMSD